VAFYDILVLISLVLWILVASGLIITLVVVVPRLLRSFSEIDRLTNVVTTQLLPVIGSIEGVAESVEKIADAALADMELVDRMVVRTTDSVERMLGIAEERVSEVNALVSVAVEEAEETFLSTAGILRAVRGGGRRKKRKKRKKKDDRWLRGGERRRLG
jgi:hypothetical protein